MAESVIKFMSEADRTIKRIKSVNFTFEAPSIGYGVDKVTGIGTPPEEKSAEERLIVTLTINGERGETVVSEPYASNIYEQVWKFLNDTPA